MSIAWFLALAAGILASIGVVGLFMTAAFKDEGRRNLCFRVGASGFTLGGLVLMLGAVAGQLETSCLYGGLLMAVFGTGANLLPSRMYKAENPDEPAR